MTDSAAKILISSCLLGEAVRYDAKGLKQIDPTIALWSQQGRLVSFCPEVSSGMGIPRAAAEIIGGSGEDVLIGSAIVVNNKHQNVTDYFIKGAQNTLKLCLSHNIKIAILTERSPSCGGQLVYNGEFNGTRIAGEGVTTALLRLNHIQVFNQHQLLEVKRLVY